MVKRIIFSVASLFFASVTFGSVVINELMPKNVSYTVSDSFQFSGWAELYNNGAEDVDIASYFFSDTSAVSDKWQVTREEAKPEKTIIPAHGYKVIYFDETTFPSALHANFKLPAKKGGLYMFDESGRQIDRMVYDTAYRNVSYGRVEDGASKNGFFAKPTMGASNNGSAVATKQTNAPVFNLKAGFYQGDQRLSISADGSAEIYYTLDGSEPTKEKGQRYQGEITLNHNTPVRAAAFREGELPSNVTAATYFINERNINLPVVSVVVDPEYLYDEQIGMFVRGKRNGVEVPSGCGGPDAGRKANYMTDWDRPANFELFDDGKKEQINQELKIGNFGACSRTKFVKSIKVNAGKVYGDNELDYPIFKEKPNLRWKSVVLRNSGNDFGRAYLRDGFMQTVACRTGVDHQAYQPSVVFLNGQYYGMLNIRERTNKDFVFSNYGYSEDEIYINVGGHANKGTTYDKVDKLSKLSESEMNAPGRFDEINSLIDVNEFLDYFLAEIYCNNTDWPGGNIKAWKPKDGGRWRWILYDTDFGLSLYSKNYNGNGISTAKKNDAFAGFIKNEEVKSRFLAKCYVHFATTYQPERMLAILDSMKQDINQEARVYERYLSDNRAVEGSFDENINLIKEFVEKRIPYVQGHVNKAFACDSFTMKISSDTKGATYKLNEELIEKRSITSVFFTHTRCKLEAIAPAGYLFDHWEVVKDGKSEKLFDAVYDDTVAAQSFKAYFVEDASYDPTVNRVVINEICTKNNIYLDEHRQSEDWIELYNSGKEAVNLAGKYLSCSKDTMDMFQFPTNDASLTTIPAGGYMIVWADKDPKQGGLHADFKLPFSLPKTIILSEKKDGKFNVLDSITYKVHDRHQSYARFVEKGEVFWEITNVITFAERNQPKSEDPIVEADNFSVVIYPNPVEDQLNVVASTDAEMEVKVLSLAGMVVAEATLRSGESIDLSSIDKGVYTLFVKSEAGMTVMKIVKN